MRHSVFRDVLEVAGQIKAETTLTAAQTKVKKERKIWFAEKVSAELAVYETKQPTQPLFFIPSVVTVFTESTLTHIVIGI